MSSCQDFLMNSFQFSVVELVVSLGHPRRTCVFHPHRWRGLKPRDKAKHHRKANGSEDVVKILDFPVQLIYSKPYN